MGEFRGILQHSMGRSAECPKGRAASQPCEHGTHQLCNHVSIKDMLIKQQESIVNNACAVQMNRELLRSYQTNTRQPRGARALFCGPSRLRIWTEVVVSPRPVSASLKKPEPSENADTSPPVRHPRESVSSTVPWSSADPHLCTSSSGI